MDERTEAHRIEASLGLARVSAGRPADRLVRKAEAARILGISPTTLWRFESAGILLPVRIMPGVSGYKESTLQAFIESCEPAKPDRERVAAALASPLHGRAGRADRTRKRPAASVANADPLAFTADPQILSAVPKVCPLCNSQIVTVGAGVYSCGDSFGLGCDWAGVIEARG